MSFIPKPHEIYKHFKGNLYQITAIAEHTETGETLVVYQAMYGDFKTYARPLTMFTSFVDRDKYPDASQKFRFELQGPDAARQKAEMGMRSRTDSADSGMSVPTEIHAEPEITDRKRQEQGEPSGQGISEPTERISRELEMSERYPEQIPSEKDMPEPDEESEELNIDPRVLEFLDADSYEQRLNILTGLRHRITDDMITTMAIACDVEIGEGDIEERYESLKTCLLTMERYECNRLR